MSQFDVVVVGNGPIGSAAARHLAGEVGEVALVGRDEPTDHRTHRGAWSGWYDEGRMAHAIDLPLLSGLLGLRARRRFDELQDRTGVTFATPVPGLNVAAHGQGADQGGDYFDVASMLSRAADLGVHAELLDEAALQAAFPAMRFAAGHVAIHQPDALLLNPRRLVLAETSAAVAAGASRISDEAVAVERRGEALEVTTRDGARLSTRCVVLAAGAYINLSGLSPRRLALSAFGATVTLAAVDPSTPAFPTTMYLKSTEHAPYAGIITPPRPYPDGRWYIKGAGASLLDAPLDTAATAEAWVRTGGDARDRASFTEVLAELLFDVRVEDVAIRPCIATINDSGYPYIGFVDDGVVVATEGEHGVTMADEIGRLAARLAIDGTWRDTLPAEPFAPRFR